MAQIPKGLESPKLKGLCLLTDGKVRGTYNRLVGRNLLLQRASNRVSIFDFILNALIDQKGEILTALTVFWLTKVLKGFSSHLVAYGSDINSYLPKNLRGDEDLMKRALVIKKLWLAPIEAIVRFFLTGSGWKNFQETGKCYGHPVPGEAWNGMELPYPIFTPTEKSDTDPWIHHDIVAKQHGSAIERTALQIAMVIRKYLQSVGLDLLDTKFELTSKGDIGDEIVTPDSSRIVDLQERIAMAVKQKLASSLDKQFVRNWGASKDIGIDKLDPTNPEHIAKVQAISVPEEIIKQTAQIYRYLFWRITGQKLETFQYKEMGILGAHPPKVKVAVVIGSRTDLEQCQDGLGAAEALKCSGRIDLEVHILSCHRNPDELKAFATLTNADVIVAGAGKAAQLPGMLKAYLANKGKKIPVIGVAFEGKGISTQAAQLSIEELPGTPVIMDKNGHAFTGSNGFYNALALAIEGEFKPEKPSEKKKAELDIQNYLQ